MSESFLPTGAGSSPCMWYASHFCSLLPNCRRIIPMHEVRIAFLSDEILRGFRFAACVEPGPRLRNRLRRKDILRDLVVVSRIVEALLRPAAVEHVQPFRGAGIAVVVLIEGDAVLRGLVRPPARNHVQREPALRDVI